MQADNYSLRRERLRERMHAKGVQALLVTLDANRFYLSGFELHDPQVDESAGCLIITADGRDWLCTDGRYLDAARTLWEHDRIFIYRGSAGEQINGLLRDIVSGTVGFEAQNISVAFFKSVSEGMRFEAVDGLVEGLRVIKDAEEIARMEQSCSLNHRLMAWVPSVLLPGRSEAEVAWDIEQFFRNNGAEALAFPSIVAVGPNAALPHAIPGSARLTEDCAVLVDVGCRLNDYCSDQTRTFWVGARPHPHYTMYYSLIKEAQSKAISAIRPGASAGDIYAIAKKHLDDNGAGVFFTHGLGHGVGLQTHEAPRLGPAGSALLKTGMVVTVEPGIYKAGYGGVRFEYMVLVTEDGARIL